MKKGVKRELKVVIISLLFVLIYSNLVFGLGEKLLCLKNGEIVKFSLCNLDIPDKTCNSNECKYCVNEIRTGVYCPVSLNKCNTYSAQECTYLIETPIEPELPKITLLFPDNDYKSTIAKTINFSFYVTRSYEINSCNLILNEKVVASSTSLIQSKTNRISYTVETGIIIGELNVL